MLAKALKRQDTLAGLLFLAIGSLALFFGRNYPAGTARMMGPGYFPRFLGGLLCILGVVILVRGVVMAGEEVAQGRLRPFLVIVAVAAFALLIPNGGLVAAVVALIIVSAAAGHEFRLSEAGIIAAALCLFAVAVFNWGLGLHLPLWPHW